MRSSIPVSLCLSLRPWRPLAAAAAVLLASGCSGPWPPPPDTRVEVVTDTIHGVEIPDPYRWLEDQESPETRAWIDAQNEYARRIVSDTELEARIAARLAELMEVPSVSAPREAGDHEIFTLRRAGESQARIYRREKSEDGDTGERPDPDGDYELLLDARELGFDEFASLDIVDVSPDGSLLLYRIRDGGSTRSACASWIFRPSKSAPTGCPRRSTGRSRSTARGRASTTSPVPARTAPGFATTGSERR